MPYPCLPLPSQSSIRVLNIGRDPLRRITARASIVELDASPRYRCLSYTWDGARYCDVDDSWTKPEQAIVFNNTIFYIRKNLYAALLQLLDFGVTEPIWIDALSIDQTNITERNNQVSQMGRIFEGAETVSVWLGKEEANTALAIRSMEKFAIDVDRLVDDVSTVTDISSLYDLLKKAFARSNYTDDELVASIDFMTTYRWFSRVWTVQETCLAASIEFFCGSKKIDMGTIIKGSFISNLWGLTSAWARLNSGEELGWARSFSANMMGELAGRKTDSTRPSVGITAQLYRSRRAADPRDKVFAVASISTLENKWISKPFEIDYGKTVQTVFSQAALHGLAGVRGLESLSDVGDRSANMIPNLPTWVPDYTRDVFPGRLLRNRNEFCAASRLQTVIHTTKENSDVIILQGHHFDTIASVCNAFWTPEDPGGVSDMLRLISDVQSVRLSDSESLSMLLERTMIADDNDCSKRDPGDDRSSGFQRWLFSQVCNAVLMQNHEIGVAFIRDPHSNLESALQMIGCAGCLEETLRDSLLQGAQQCASEESVRLAARGRRPFVDSAYASFMDTQLYEYYSDWEAVCQYRKLLRTQGGYIGLALSCAQHEDRVYLLQGAIVPHIFRHQPKDEENVLDFEGESYVHGIMYGEAASNDNLEFQRITIY
ncbi:MAG: hypothetical protein M1821_007089 [Bathelium mastoideum]|nr:MAG: hypothetical protein M1821_007089 [Bathelium mastoideum]